MTDDREIDALLRRDETCSVIDRLMALPHHPSQKSNEWERAVAGRFEAHLARQMRSLIDGAEAPRAAA